MLSGDLGTSSVYQDSVNTLLGSRLPVSVFLIVYSTLLTVLIGLVGRARGCGAGRRASRGSRRR